MTFLLGYNAMWLGSQDLLGGSFVGWPAQWFHTKIITSDRMVAYVDTYDIFAFCTIIFADHKVFFNL